jgi:hypothetical protein
LGAGRAIFVYGRRKIDRRRCGVKGTSPPRAHAAPWRDPTASMHDPRSRAHVLRCTGAMHSTRRRLVPACNSWRHVPLQVACWTGADGSCGAARARIPATMRWHVNCSPARVAPRRSSLVSNLEGFDLQVVPPSSPDGQA